ncbi:MAG: cation:proton antiporter, partial [Hyphomicrobium sp.]|nr:cation:proton antiporter [Hyphomicrobium sp.]
MESTASGLESAAANALEAAADGLKQVAASSTHGDLTGIAIVVLAALACGIGMERLRQPAIVGYIVAGVLLLLYVVGMELSLRIFKRLWKVALVATLMQIGVSTGAMLLLSRAFGWPFGVALVTGFAVALSSTAVAIKILDDLGETRTKAGRITIGVLIAQDLAVVPMMLTIDALAGGG